MVLYCSRGPVSIILAEINLWIGSPHHLGHSGNSSLGKNPNQQSCRIKAVININASNMFSPLPSLSEWNLSTSTRTSILQVCALSPGCQTPHWRSGSYSQVKEAYLGFKFDLCKDIFLFFALFLLFFVFFTHNA